MAAPEVWGPHVWRLLHLLADVSDRRDIFPLWNTFIKHTALTIPCQKCQIHMKEYLTRTTFMPKGWDQMSAVQTRDAIRLRIHTFHNAVNERLGKPQHPELPADPTQHRTEILLEITAVFETVKSVWGRVAYISGPAFLEWKRCAQRLIQIVHAGPY